MGRIVLILSFTFVFGNLFSQDTITKRSSEIIIAKILEISPTEIKYKKFTFLDGPTYFEKKSEIKMIVYSNGAKETFEQGQEQQKQVADNNEYYAVKANTKIDDFKQHYRYQNRIITQSQMQTILLETKDIQIAELVKKSKEAREKEKKGLLALPLLGGVIACIGVGSLVALSGGEQTAYIFAGIGSVCLGGVIAFPIVSGVNRAKKIKLNSEAIKLYNQKY